ncbi:MAG: hypothetical protein RJA81_1522 [Planctomycetota bacterium]
MAIITLGILIGVLIAAMGILLVTTLIVIKIAFLIVIGLGILTSLRILRRVRLPRPKFELPRLMPVFAMLIFASMLSNFFVEREREFITYDESGQNDRNGVSELESNDSYHGEAQKPLLQLDGEKLSKAGIMINGVGLEKWISKTVDTKRKRILEKLNIHSNDSDTVPQRVSKENSTLVIACEPCATKEKATDELRQKLQEHMVREIHNSGYNGSIDVSDPFKIIGRKPQFDVSYKEVAGEKYPVYVAKMEIPLNSHYLEKFMRQSNQKQIQDRFGFLLSGSVLLIVGLGIWRKFV